MRMHVSLLVVLALAVGSAAAGTDYFAIHVVDEDTGRGVPLVELRTGNNIRYFTDSAGWVAFYEPGLMGREVFFLVSSDGYEYPADGFGYRGVRLETRPGGEATIKIKRLEIAERVYRVTGGGIYRDSVLLGRAVPIREPVINGDVLGQDSVQNVVYQGKLYWFWGDTGWPTYPLGNFRMSGATSALPSGGGLGPDVGVDLTYFVRENGFAKEMAPHPGPGPVWMDAFVTLPDESGRERMYGAYARVTAGMKAVERGFMRFNDDKQIFEKVAEFDVETPAYPSGHPFVHPDGGVAYIWFPSPFPLVRVRADANSYLDASQCEAWTPLAEGSRLDSPEIDRDAAGRIRYAWKRNTPALDQKHQDELIKAGKMKAEEAWIQLRDVDTGKPVMAHSGSVYWNDYRQRWITIRCESLGTSVLGETWYAEADTPLGPWVYARKIVTHRQYSFYNPKQHPVFDQDGGRVIYFEGTYANTFSGNPDKTPRYDYNQIMYRLSLDDERLVLPAPVYRVASGEAAGVAGAGGESGGSLATRTQLHAQSAASKADEPGQSAPHTIAFFALDRPVTGAVAMRCSSDQPGTPRLVAVPAGEIKADDRTIAFFALPADFENPPATSVPLYEFVSEGGGTRMYATDAKATPAGSRRSDAPVCRVWRNPLMAEWRWR